MAGTESAAGALVRVHYTHDAMIDILIAEPQISQGLLARRFGYTEAWLSRIINCDAFQERLAERRAELVNPAIISSIEERLKGLTMQATDVLAQQLEINKNPEVALKTLDIATKALGYGARNVNTQVAVTNYVVAMPEKIVDANEWAKAHGRAPVTVEGKVEET